MIATALYLLGILAALGVGAAMCWFVMRATEPHRFARLLEVEDALRESAGGLIRQQQLHTPVPGSVARWNPTDAYDLDADGWEQAADVLGVPISDYTPREGRC